MTDETADSPTLPNATELQTKVEMLSVENLVLKQQMEFQRLLTDDREKLTYAFAQYKKEMEADLFEHREEVSREINKRLVGMTVLGLIVAGIAWWSTITPVRKIVTDRLNQEFASENIRVLISDAARQAAQAQSKQLIEGTLRPATEQALQEIKRQREEVTNSAQHLQNETNAAIAQIRKEITDQANQDKAAMQNLRQEYSKSLSDLRVLVAYQEQLKDIELLKNAAIDGDVSSFYKLAPYDSPDRSLIVAAEAAAMQVKIMYISATRTKATTIFLNNPDGSRGLADQKIPTQTLIHDFLWNQKQPWAGRAKAAEVLADRREEDVPVALLAAMQSDPNLWVRRTAFRSFTQLTGFQEVDVFDFDGASNWWLKNKDEFLKSIPKK